MAVAPDDLKEPAGELVLAWFPEDAAAPDPHATFDARLTAYIADGTAKATDAGLTGADIDSGTAAWAYYRAYSAICKRLANAPQTASLADQGSRTYASDQRRTFCEAASAKLSEWSALLATLVDATPSFQRTLAVPVSFSW